MAEEALETELDDNLPPPDVDPVEQEYENKARRMGWRPKDEYSGNPDRWVDARTFVLRGEAELPILRERFRKMDTEFASVKTELTDTKKKLNEASEVLVELRDMSRGAEERAYNRAVGDLKERQRQAVAEASVDKFEAAQREIDSLKPPQAPPPPPADRAPPPPARTDTAPPNPVYVEWMAENPWFNTDRMLNAVAIEEERVIQAESPGMATIDQLSEVKRRVMERFPEKFGLKRPTRPSSVALSSAPPSKPKGRTVKDLPPEAKKALERFKAQIPGYKDEEYLAMYYAGEAE